MNAIVYLKDLTIVMLDDEDNIVDRFEVKSLTIQQNILQND